MEAIDKYKGIKKINIKAVKPMFNSLITTNLSYEKDVVDPKTGLVIIPRGTLREHQVVVAVGDLIKSIKVGDLVCINPAAYAKRKFKEGSIKQDMIEETPTTVYQFNTIDIDHVPHLLLYDRDIKYVVSDYEDEEEVSTQNLILPNKEFII